MSIADVDRMREALIRDDMNYLATLSRDDLFRECEALIIAKWEAVDNDTLLEEYESLA